MLWLIIYVYLSFGLSFIIYVALQVPDLSLETVFWAITISIYSSEIRETKESFTSQDK